MKNLTSTQIAEVKKDLNKIIPVIQALLTVWPSNGLLMVSVLIQNLCFMPSSSSMNLDEEYEKMANIIIALDEIAKYDSNNHTISWIKDEVKMSWDGYWFSVDQDLLYSHMAGSL